MAGQTILNTKECVFSQTSVNVLGRKFVGIRGFELKKTVEKEELYGNDDDPIDIQSGIKKYSGSLTLLKYEVDLLNDAAQAAGYEDITEVPHELISGVIQFKKDGASRIRNMNVSGIAFTDITYAMKQGDKMMEVSLPFICMKFKTV